MKQPSGKVPTQRIRFRLRDHLAQQVEFLCDRVDRGELPAYFTCDRGTFSETRESIVARRTHLGGSVGNLARVCFW